MLPMYESIIRSIAKNDNIVFKAATKANNSGKALNTTTKTLYNFLFLKLSSTAVSSMCSSNTCFSH